MRLQSRTRFGPPVRNGLKAVVRGARGGRLVKVMNIQKTIEEKLAARFDPPHLAVINESHQHNVPDGSESHFKVVLVSTAFEGKNLVAQHRMVYELLFEELQSQVHALALHTYTPAAWNAGAAPTSPECMGGKSEEGA